MFVKEAENIKYAVIGDPVAHSVSPAMQNAAFMAAGLSERYGKYHVVPEKLAEFVEFARCNLLGFNATVPHKSALIGLLDEITPEALAARSVNTVTVRGNRLYGDSTDGYGLETALKESFGFNIAGGRIVLLGAGGAAQAAAFEFVRRGAAEVTVINRTVSKAEALVRALAAVEGANTALTALGNDETSKAAAAVAACDVVIQATSSGLHPDDAPPLALEILREAPAIFDMIYKNTPVLQFAKNNNIPCADGRLMLLHQGAKSFSIWTMRPAATAAMRDALDEALGK